MGMYTGLRIKGYVKDEYKERIYNLFNTPEYSWEDFEEQTEVIKVFSKFGRSTFIPFGGLCCMPKEWETNEDFKRNFDEKTGEISFSCSLKNYGSEIEYFLNYVVEEIFATVEQCEVFYEEWAESDIYIWSDETREFIVIEGKHF